MQRQASTPSRGLARDAQRGNAAATEAPPTYARAMAEDQQRRKHNVGLIAIGDMTILSLLLPATLYPHYDVSGFPTVLAALVFAALAALLNARGAVKAAAYVLVWSLLVASVVGICGVALTNGGLDLSEVRLFDLFTIPIVLSAITVSRRAPLTLAGITSACTTVLLLVLPRTPALEAYYLQRYAAAPGSVYDIFAFALALQWGVAIVSYVGSRSVAASLHHAIQVDALAEAQRQVAEQREELLRRNRRLEDGIQRIQAVYAAAMRGQWKARVQSPDNELLPLALSFNRLLDRTAHFMSVSDEHQRLLAAIAQLEGALRARACGQIQPIPHFTGTALDEICEQLRELEIDFPPSTPDTAASSAHLH